MRPLVIVVKKTAAKKSTGQKHCFLSFLILETKKKQARKNSTRKLSGGLGTNKSDSTVEYDETIHAAINWRMAEIISCK